MSLMACFVIGLVANAALNLVSTWHAKDTMQDFWLRTFRESCAMSLVVGIIWGWYP